MPTEAPTADPPSAPAIVQYWHQNRPPRWILAALASFRERNPELRHLVFDEESAAAFLADRFSPREVAAFRACAVPAMQADYFRYCAVLALGGLYADADLRCIAGLRPLIESGCAGTLFGRPGPVPDHLVDILRWPRTLGRYSVVSNGLFAFERAGHPLLELAVEVATLGIERRIADGGPGVWVVAGPGIFTSTYFAHRLGSLEAFLDFSAGTILEPAASLFCEVAGSFDRIERALSGVSILPRDEDALAWVAWSPPAKADEAEEPPVPHWTNPRGSIFRSSGAL